MNLADKSCMLIFRVPVTQLSSFLWSWRKGNNGKRDSRSSRPGTRIHIRPLKIHVQDKFYTRISEGAVSRMQDITRALRTRRWYGSGLNLNSKRALMKLVNNVDLITGAGAPWWKNCSRTRLAVNDNGTGWQSPKGVRNMPQWSDQLLGGKFPDAKVGQ